jgi:hypothetical protein
MNEYLRTWLAVWVILIGALCYRSLNSDFFPLIVAVSFISSSALAVAALKTGGTGIKRYSLIVGIVVFVLTTLVSFLKMSIT